jgi:hypothetical protein
MYPITRKKKVVEIFNSLIFVSVLSILATIFYTITPHLIFSSGINDHMIDSTNTQTKSSNESKKIALIENMFTYAACQNGSLWYYENKWSYIRSSKVITVILTDE